MYNNIIVESVRGWLTLSFIKYLLFKFSQLSHFKVPLRQGKRIMQLESVP